MISRRGPLNGFEFAVVAMCSVILVVLLVAVAVSWSLEGSHTIRIFDLRGF